MITVSTANRGNLALEMQTFKIPVGIALQAAKEMEVKPGSYWETALLKPARRAKRAKAEFVSVYTAGFGASELSNRLFNMGYKVDWID